jgi:hypothetical protein
VAGWAYCSQCRGQFWAGDSSSYKSVPAPPRFPGEGMIRHWRRTSSRTSHLPRGDPNSQPGGVCEECSAANEEEWTAYEELVRQPERLEAVERMLAGLRQPVRDEDQIEPGWNARRAELIKELDAERAALLEDL